LPSFATLPLLMAYAGHTTIVIPKPLVSYIGLEVFDLGTIHLVYSVKPSIAILKFISLVVYLSWQDVYISYIWRYWLSFAQILLTFMLV